MSWLSAFGKVLLEAPLKSLGLLLTIDSNKYFFWFRLDEEVIPASSKFLIISEDSEKVSRILTVFQPFIQYCIPLKSIFTF